MVLCVSALLYKHADLNPNPQHSCKKPRVTTPELTGHQLRSRLNERPCLKGVGCSHDRVGHHLASSSALLISVHRCTHLHTHTFVSHTHACTRVHSHT